MSYIQGLVMHVATFCICPLGKTNEVLESIIFTSAGPIQLLSPPRDIFHHNMAGVLTSVHL